MVKAHRLDREATAVDCRFIVRSENEEEAVEFAKKHAQEIHGHERTDEELREDRLQVV